MYLTYDEYVNLGGALDESAFNILEFEAESYVDWYTFNRLQGEEEIPRQVKMCMFVLMDLVKAKNADLTPKFEADGSFSAQLSSQSNDGVSLTYGTMSASDSVVAISAEIPKVVNRYLNGVVNSLGRKLLYRGLYPGE